MDKIQESESYRFIHFTPKEGLSGIKVHSILQDENGRMWFSNLGAGVSILTPSDSNQEEKGQFRYITEKDGLCSDFVLNLFQAKNKSMYFGTRFGLSSISTENLQKFFNELNNSIKVVPFIWPCGNKLGIIRDYYYDQNAATGVLFQRDGRWLCTPAGNH